MSTFIITGRTINDRLVKGWNETNREWILKGYSRYKKRRHAAKQLKMIIKNGGYATFDVGITELANNY